MSLINKPDQTFQEYVFIIITSISIPVFITLFGVVVGYDISETLREHPVSKSHYIFIITLFGGGAGFAWQRGVRATTTVAGLALVGWLLTRNPGRGHDPLTDLNVGLTVLFVLVTVAATVEYGVRNPDAVRRTFTRRAVAVGSLAGGILVVVRVLFDFRFDRGIAVVPFLWPPSNFLILLWSYGGLLVLGFAVGLLFARAGLILPGIVAGATFAWATYAGWQALRASPEASLVVFDLYLFGWWAVLALALVAGGIEWGVRSLAGRPA